MSTKPDSGTGDHPTVESPPPGAKSQTESEATEHLEAGAGAEPDDAEVEVEVDGSGSEAHIADDDSDIAIEVEAPEPEPDPTAELAAELEELQAVHAELEKKHKDTYERLLRATADLDNFRKRARRDVDNAKLETQSKTLIEILPVVDNLERAVAHSGGGGDSKGIADGVNLVLRQFGQALERCGVAPVEAVGQPFDPNVHEAVSQQESSDHPPGTVVAELQKGYVIGERLLRPTLAVVSTAPAEPAEVDEPPKSNGHDTSPDAVAAASGGDAGAAEPTAEEAADDADATAAEASDRETEADEGSED